jgi:predicted KAP-like P-loop ATPase
MRLFPPPLEIGDEEGFTKEKDIFGRSGIGRGLTNIISRVTDPLVIAVDNEWGTGKTTFLKMWAGELRKLGVPVIYFDAFQHDYVEDAFTANHFRQGAYRFKYCQA